MIDDLERRETFQRGPWPNPHRAVARAYIDTRAIDYECVNCGAKVSEFCTLPEQLGGDERKTPCPKRIATAVRDRRQSPQSETAKG